MSEEKEQVQVQEPNENLLEKLDEVKKNTVPIEKYNEVMRQNKELLDKYWNHDPSQSKEGSGQEDKWKDFDPNKARETLFKKDNVSNLEFVETALKLRDWTLEKEGRDIFVGNINPKLGFEVSEAEAKERAENAAECFRHCIEVANGDSGLFTLELQRITRDVTLPRR